MRLLIPISAHEKLHMVGEWWMVEQFINANSDRGWYYVLIPAGSVPTFGTLPRTTVLRVNCDSSYFFIREIGDFFNINDGKYIIDAACPMTPQMATGIDLFCNTHGFNESNHDIAISIWQCMFYFYRSNKLKRLSTNYYNVFDGQEDYDLYCDWVRKEFKPSVAEKIMKNGRAITLGCNMKPVHEKSKKFKKFDKKSILYGSRMNDMHKPSFSVDLMVTFYEMGYDFDAYITTSDKVIPQDIVDKANLIGAKLIPSCTQDQYHTLMARCHIGLTSGFAAAPTYGLEFLSAGTICIMQDTQWLDILKNLEPEYPYVFHKKNEAIFYMKKVYENIDECYREFNSYNYWDQIKHKEFNNQYRLRYDTFFEPIKIFKKRKSGGILGYRTKIFLNLLASVGGEATLTEMVENVERNNGIVRNKQIGRWITRKLIHDLLMSNPSVVDLEDGPEPKYQLDYDLYREWLNSCSIE